MRWRSLAAALLMLFITFNVVAVNQSQDETGTPSIETKPVDQSQNETSLSTSDIQVEATQYPFKLITTLGKTEFKVGKPVEITLCVENIGNETAFLLPTRGIPYSIFIYNGTILTTEGYYPGFVVYDENNSVVWNDYEKMGFNCTSDILTAGPPIILEPGEEYVATHTWFQKDGWVFNGLDADPPAYYKKVPPGTYYVVGTLSERAGHIVETPPIKIIIIEEPPTGITVKVARYPFNLTRTLDKTEFKLGETVRITLRLENIRNRTATLSHWWRADFVYVVYNETNSVIWDEHSVVIVPAVIGYPTLIRPGGELTVTYTWEQRIRLVYVDMGQVPPGTYRIIGKLLHSYSIETPSITITIAE